MRPPENEKNGESYNSPFFMYLHRCRSVDIPPVGFVVRRSGFHLDLQFDHIDGRGGGFVALVAVTASAAVQSLLHVVHGQHTEGDGHVPLDLQLRDALRNALTDKVEMTGISLNDAAQRDHGVHVGIFGEELRAEGQFERPRNILDLDARRLRAELR